MKALEIIKELEKFQKVIFSINDLAKIIKKSRKYSSLVLYRLKKKGLIIEIERNKYVPKDMSPYVLSNLIYPSYLSFLTAFSYYNLTAQIPKQIQIVSLKSKKEIEFENYKLKFVKFKPNRFFGYKREKMAHGFIFIAELEKAIIDSLFLPKYCPIDETFNVLNEAIKNINLEKLIDYALKMKSKVVLKRLGYLLEKKNINIYNKIKDKLNKKYDNLDILSNKGKKNKKWRIIINRTF
ncbi:type IV toxin-antitoxin system AbiEi family antitoxin domain-containing protein [Candidatus Pacearchaeota archaeon]|nr:type IV toxin-antitoxin system AbiEi family antitoxin domain-containing protein [Candidatus Pacearchaeota archaeon]